MAGGAIPGGWVSAEPAVYTVRGGNGREDTLVYGATPKVQVFKEIYYLKENDQAHL